jgi:hypothetical protein
MGKAGYTTNASYAARAAQIRSNRIVYQAVPAVPAVPARRTRRTRIIRITPTGRGRRLRRSTHKPKKMQS